MKLPSCIAACRTAFLSDLFVLFRFFVSHVKFVLNWTFDIFAEFPTFVFNKTFNCHFRSHVLADSATEIHCANYTGYFVGAHRVEMNHAWNQVLPIELEHFLLDKTYLKHHSEHLRDLVLSYLQLQFPLRPLFQNSFLIERWLLYYFVKKNV